MSDDETVVRQRLLRLLGDRVDPQPIGRIDPPVDRAESQQVGRIDPLVRGAPVRPVRRASPVRSVAELPPDGVMAHGPAIATQHDWEKTPHDPETTPPDGQTPAGRRLSDLGAFDPGRRGVRALAAVAALVVLAAAGWAWRSRTETEPIALDPPSASAAVTAAAPVTTATGVVVAVAGKVRRPGLVRLPAGARVADAVAGAGGILPGTDTALLNLARKVDDGELILVGLTPPPGTEVAADAAGGAAGGGKVNLNTATLAQLDSLPGVGPVLAQRILDHRARHGPFRSVGDLRQIDGIGDARYEELKNLVTV